MAYTKFIAHGFLGYEVVIGGSVQTNVLFALADEKQTSLAWYGFKTESEQWHDARFDQHDNDIDHYGRAVNAKPELDCDFAGVDAAGALNAHPGPFSVAGLVARGSRSGAAVPADIDMRDLKTGMTACVLSIPSVQPAGLMLAFNLRPVRKRRTLDLKKPGRVRLIVIQQYSRIALVNGPIQPLLNNAFFRGRGSKQLCP